MEMSELSEWVNDIHQGDSFELLTELPESSVHAVVTDPPYGLAFMGRDWDDFEPKEYQEWCENWARRAKRVLKPGGAPAGLTVDDPQYLADENTATLGEFAGGPSEQ